MKRDYDLRVASREYLVGDRVYVLDTATVKGQCRKLSPSWKGPGVITERLSPYLYRIKLGNKMVVANHDRLKECRDRDVPKGSKSSAAALKDAVFCFCRRPYTGAFMVMCDGCQEWYHGRCVNVSPEEGTHIDKYFCPVCRALKRS
ncbi:uncharacterized protein [Diadema antillarum]|uniref:uncharacterized protein n=1 Tax=Diadema antillarum TaxID=105358 RepID=UPI003A8376A2